VRLSTFLKPDLIKPNCQSENLQDLFVEIVESLHTAGYIKNKKIILTKLMEREKLGATSLGNNSAVPHAKIKGLEETIVFLSISRKGIKYGIDDNNKNNLINIIILILSPAINSNVSHLQTLAAAVSFIKNCPDFIRNTMKMNQMEILEYLKKKELEYDQ
jgi:mannitol/fructose-specific phosphotransferase system IIA component (Ntr-type)